VSRGALFGALLVLGLAAAFGARDRMAGAPPSERARAQALYQRAQQAQRDERASNEFDLLVEALATDPTYIPVLADVSRHPKTAAMWSDAWPAIDAALRRIRDPDLADCARKVELWSHGEFSEIVLRNEASAAARECAELFGVLSKIAARCMPDRVMHGLRLWRRYPDSPALGEWVTSALYQCKNWPGLHAVAEEMIGKRKTPAVRGLGYAMLVRWAENAPAKGDSTAYRLDQDAAAALGPVSSMGWLTYLTTLEQLGREPADSVRAMSDPVARLRFLELRGIRAYGDGDLRLSENIWKDILRSYRRSVDAYAQAQLYLGRTYVKAGRLNAAEAALLAARDVAMRIGDQGTMVDVEHYLFHTYEASNRRREALDAGYQFIALTGAPQRAAGHMMSYHDVGWYYWRLGEYEKARAMLGRMLAIIESLDTDHYWAGEYYERVGDLQRAMQTYARANAKDPLDFRSVARRSLLAAQMGDSATAIQLAQAHDTAFGHLYPEFTPLLPSVYATFGMSDAAAAAAERAENVARERKQAAAVANLQLERATLELRRHRPDIALALADSAAHTARDVAGFEVEAIARGTRALAAVLVRQHDTDLDSIVAIANGAAARRLPQLQLTLRTLLGDAYAARGRRLAALRSYETAAALNDSIARSLSSDANRARFRSAKNDVSGKALSLIIRSPTRAQADDFTRWSAERKAHGAERFGRVRHLAAVAPDEAAIDYVVLADTVAALLRTHDRTRLVVLPVNPDTLARQVRAFRELLTPRIGGAIDVRRSTFDAALAHQLYEELVAPFAGDLVAAKKLVIVADGVLHYLPFDALVTSPVNDGARPAYLLERFTIRNAPSPALLSSEHGPVTGSVVAFAGDGPEAESEIASLAATRSVGLHFAAIGPSEATERKVRTESGRASVIHFAAHAEMNDVEPLFAFLALRADSVDDGKLRAFEIEQLRLKGALVVLSGCDTGGGRLAGGEGVLSLSRAFLRAGASATVATLWPIGPATTDIMKTFYAALGAGSSPAEALRQAKLRALNGPHASPLYWAPFVLISS
jgi:CHAT domain-containing protein